MNPLGKISCPVQVINYDRITLAHGGGGRISQNLIRDIFLPEFGNPMLDLQHDGAIFEQNGTRFAFSTDSYVVNPIFFPGGNIGDLAVNGTVNDLSMCGARPLYISAGFIIEEGFGIEELRRIVVSMQQAAERSGVRIVTGDTKVVDKGKGDNIFINTSGVGVIEQGRNISPLNSRPGDSIILSGRIARHGIAVMSAREGLKFESEIKSDTAALNKLVDDMFGASGNIHVLRDPTRGGISSALNEIAQSSQTGMLINEADIPVDEAVKAACEILGLDPLYIANEGRLIAIVAKDDAEVILSAMKKNELGHDAVIIGEVSGDNPGKVIMKTSIGSNRIVDMLSGEQLPRIC